MAFEIIRASVPWLKAVNPEGAVADPNMVLHPGALRALEELGVMISAVGRG